MSEPIYTSSYQSPVGELILGTFEDKLCLCDWKYRKMRSAIDERIKRRLESDYEAGGSPTMSEAIVQLDEYFKDERAAFDLPLLMLGTDFQKQVWHALLKIPYGTTMTYLELSKSLNNEKGIRAVAAANGANAISIIVPCHRIIGSDGSFVGYAGGLAAKKKLLQLEGALDLSQLQLF